MIRQRLLERLRFNEEHPDNRVAGDSGLVVNSVLNYLRMVLNTKQGNAEIAPDFGVPDFGDMVGSEGLEAVRDIEIAMTEVITKYEPRLQNVHVEYIPDETNILALQFKLRAELMLEKSAFPVIFETLLDPDGKISVLEN
ncbi:type VI secretion system baseplate subunit TssE [Celerinatantimonas sp. MCCC 1A17872]|uniref:type VI secretion system baseplate subunit TssE n=1 Tax=Celerinatantimonas sp. MCCC 1A17872 TaxID=3177514 RepID=UPI0038C0D592